MSNLDFCGNCGISIHSDSRYCSKCQAYIDIEAIALRHVSVEAEDEDGPYKPSQSSLAFVMLFSEEEAERLFGTSHGGMDADDKADQQRLRLCCFNCGGQMLGDGYTTVYHCEFVDPSCVEPDADPIYCNERRC